MCRWAAWSGAPKFLEELICDPEHSLIHQSRNAFSCKTQVNADGFGLAWYDSRKEPCVYKDVRPAWADANLLQLAHHVRSPLFLAHIRASTGTATSHDNCHPFTHGRWSFMHNGQIGGYGLIRKRLDAMIPDHLYQHRTGATDSEALFLIAVGYGLDHDPVGAMRRAVQEVEDVARAHGQLPYMRFAAVWSDGRHLFAARYASDNRAPSLFYRSFVDGTSVVSEPLDEAPEAWTEVKSGMIVLLADGYLEEQRFNASMVSAA
ncbi:class II glutamine amidotransferase [Roseibium polysiphoniae]|uniref:Class II glutamine amidotransferase n=1 Tax=Roseibium polysiphoniae TaxID=2571221 RepID=A0A944GS35_9HYPH|nr:class II glutamine amidotransferase [Roseibium polysiphoniae]MBS8259824.1 class II glutamine amidotransferase [Roseibium polysiphoniae]